MAWLSTSELATYAPSATAGGLTAILAAQAGVMAYLGYDLELSERVEILKPTRKTQTVHLSYRPIASTPDPVIEVREGNTTDAFNRAQQLSDWYQLEAGDFVLDSTGLLSLNTANVSLGFDRISGDISYVRATYTAGIDFSGTTTEVELVKAALGQVITYQSSERYREGIEQISIDDFYQVRYDTGANAVASGTIPAGLLTPFAKYRAVGSAIFA